MQVFKVGNTGEPLPDCSLLSHFSEDDRVICLAFACSREASSTVCVSGPGWRRTQEGGLRERSPAGGKCTLPSVPGPPLSKPVPPPAGKGPGCPHREGGPWWGWWRLRECWKLRSQPRTAAWEQDTPVLSRGDLPPPTRHPASLPCCPASLSPAEACTETNGSRGRDTKLRGERGRFPSFRNIH